MTPSSTPLRRALSMTAVFAGPGFLMLILISAFLGALQPMPGAKQAMRAEGHDASLIISINGGGRGERTSSKRSYLLIPRSFQEGVLFVVDRNERSRLTISRSSPAAFYTLASIAAVACALTVFISIPALWRLFRPHAALAIDSDEGPLTTDDHAQL